jgi:regulator of protease activity HflC (stomatin/prohibitin superfamily)
VSLRVQYLDVSCDTKTKDNVFVKVIVAGKSNPLLHRYFYVCFYCFFPLFPLPVQYKVIEDKVPSAFYKLTDARSQIRSYVFDVVRSSLPRMDLDAAFASKDEIANSVKNQLAHQMVEYGYEIIATLVIDLDPNAHVKAAMNEINASQRLREAAAERAEAEKILQVKAAEAEAESKYLSGLGVAKQRKAIVDGLRDTVTGFSHDVNGAGPKDVLDLLLISQYFDMLKDLGQKKAGSTLFLPHGPHAISDIREQLQKSFASSKR